ncbi:hypothetical protein PR202_gb23980 [Eleusine coracana subsp. coracana]|uniref:Uncharacterized protein n=1 Tax=Eleusine coracana subsp. coracana TaxID=191504 RepID=A0AAV5FL93_ELECO|nr:hypothetical protein PR202_gb23980 [Eleusine coracana subsp. coracana]
MQKGDVGTLSLAILYAAFMLFSVIASPVVAQLGTKRALVAGTSSYVLFILANLVPTWGLRGACSIEFQAWQCLRQPTESTHQGRGGAGDGCDKTSTESVSFWGR